MRILIVEDTDTIASLVQIYLMGWKLDFDVVKNGREALEHARKRTPDLVLSDVQMPEMDGFALCAALRSDRSLFNTPVVLLTSLTDDASRQRGKMVGATAFLTKPVSVTDLRQTVSNILKVSAPR